MTLFTTITSAADLVDMRKVNPNIRLDIRYATTNNFTGEVLYPAPFCFVHKDVAPKLDAIQKELEQQNLGLKVFDCYRPIATQARFWEILPDERYVSNPKKGSRHTRGTAVDLTLVDSDGNELEMPTDFDDFSEHAHTTFMDLPKPILENRNKLHQVMQAHGLNPLPTEWWHFDLEGFENYPVIDVGFAELIP